MTTEAPSWARRRAVALPIPAMPLVQICHQLLKAGMCTFGRASNQGNFAGECTERHGPKRFARWGGHFDGFLLWLAGIDGFGALECCQRITHQ